MSSFDLRKFLVENRLTTASKINEDPGMDSTALEFAVELVGRELEEYIVKNSPEKEDLEDKFTLYFVMNIPEGMDPEQLARNLRRLSYRNGPGRPFLKVRASQYEFIKGDIKMSIYVEGGLVP